MFTRCTLGISGDITKTIAHYDRTAGYFEISMIEVSKQLSMLVCDDGDNIQKMFKGTLCSEGTVN